MAKYFFDANKYPVGTTLEDLGFVVGGASPPVGQIAVADLGATGRKYWKDTTLLTGKVFTLAGITTADQSISMICDFTQAESGVALHVNPVLHNTGSVLDPNNARIVKDGAAAVISTENPAMAGNDYSGFLETKATAIILSLASNVVQVKAWQADVGGLVSAEPASWDASVAKGGTKTGSPGFISGGSFIDSGIKTFACTAIGIGTGADIAPIAAVPSQIVTTPTGLSATDITFNSARLNWT